MTDRQVSIEGIDVLRVLDGKIVQRWGVADCLSLMQELKT